MSQLDPSKLDNEDIQSTQESNNAFSLEFISPYKFVPTPPPYNDKISKMFKRVNEINYKH